MKRWISGAMAFIMTLTCAQGGLALATEAGEAEMVNAQVEEAAVAVAEAPEEVVYADVLEAEAQSDPIEQEATLGEDTPETPEGEQSGPEAIAETPAPRYARIAGDAPVLDAPDGEIIATASEGVVLALEDGEEWAKVALYTERGVLTGFVAAGDLRTLDADEALAYLDRVAENAAVALYNDDINTPLELVTCVFPEVAETTDAAAEEPAAAPEAEETTGAETAPENTEENTDPETPAEPEAESEAKPEAEPAIEAEATPEPEAGSEPDAEPVNEVEPEATAEPEPEVEIVAAPMFEAETAAADQAEPVAEVMALEAAEEAVEIAETEDESAKAAAAASMSVNMTSCTLGLKESFSGLAVSGASGVTWSTSDKKIVKVDASTGVIKGVKKGTATVTATAADGNSVSVKVTVVKAPKKIKFSAKKLNMSAGGMSVPLTVKLTAGSASAGITYTSSNEKVVTVDSNGLATSHTTGSAVITATTYNKKKATLKVNVYAAPTRVEMPETYALAVDQRSTLGIQPWADGTPTVAGLTFTVSSNSPNPDCVTVDSANGVVVGVKKGTAYITAVTHNGLTCGPCTVTVTTEAKSLKLPAKLTIGLKEARAQIPCTLTTASGDAAGAEITWSSSNAKVVKVDPATGAIMGMKKGSATIVAKTSTGLKAKCKVTVKKAPGKVTIQPASSTVSVGKTVQFNVKLPKGTAGACTYATSDPGVVVISDSGLAKGVGAGKASVTVTTYNGKTASATITVTGGASVGSSGGSSDTGATDTSTTDTSTKAEVDVPASMEKLGIASYQNVYSADMSNEEKLEYVIYHAQTQLGMPYIYGKGYKTAHPDGFDCSGFVYWCFYKLGIQLGNSAYKQGYDNHYTKISDIEDLRRGDVVCFNTSSDSDLSDHTGIYLGNGYFIHASSGKSKRKVVVQRMYNDSISSDYYKRNFSWGRRILN